MTHIHDGGPEPNQEQELFVAFANTLEHTRGEPQETIPDSESLLSWLRDRGLISARARTAEAARLRRDTAEAERRLQRFRRLREVLHGTAADIAADGRPSPAHVAELNHILRHGLHYHQLRHDPRATSYEVTQVGDRLDQARAAIAGSFAHFLADGAAERLRVCANDGCRYVFIDRSPTGRRRWCDMRTCGNQAKVARHRARSRRASEGIPQADASV